MRGPGEEVHRKTYGCPRQRCHPHTSPPLGTTLLQYPDIVAALSDEAFAGTLSLPSNEVG